MLNVVLIPNFLYSLNLASPEYEIVESGPDHDKSFVAVAIVGSEKFPSGEGKVVVGIVDAFDEKGYDISCLVSAVQ